MRMKAECFPYDDFDRPTMEGFLAELFEAELLVEYEFEGQKYVQVTGWHHQKIDKKSYKFPPFLEDNAKNGPADIRPYVVEASPNGSRGLPEALPPEGKGRERRGEERSLPIGRMAEVSAGVEGQTRPTKAEGRKEGQGQDASTEGQATGRSSDDEFEKFWAAVSRKEKKSTARSAFSKARKRYSLEHIVSLARRYYAPDVPAFLRQFLCQPATFLNNHLDDEPDEWDRVRSERMEREGSGGRGGGRKTSEEIAEELVSDFGLTLGSHGQKPMGLLEG